MTVGDRCPCGTGIAYGSCCGRFHAGDGTQPPTAEAVMRSRYSAFVVGDADHLLATWDPETRPSRLRIDPAREWLGLEVIDVERGTMFDPVGEVEFVADFAAGDGHHRLHERSRFRRVDGRWVYTDAVWAEIIDR